MTCTCGYPETWRKVKGWPYRVSSHGRVRHVDSDRIRSLALTAAGYQMVGVTNGPRRRNLSVHRMVARAFEGPPPSTRHHVNHLDGVKAHNCSGNLCWATPSENQRHAFRTGLRSGLDRQGEKHPMAKLTEEIVLAARAEYASSDVRIKDLAQRYGVSIAGMQDAVKGKTWSHLPGAVQRSVVRCVS